MEQLEQALLTFQLPQDAPRRAAEQAITQLWQQNVPLATQLHFELLAASKHESVRKLCAVLLRHQLPRFVSGQEESRFEQLPPEVRNAVLGATINVLQGSDESEVLRLTADMAGELGAIALSGGDGTPRFPEWMTLVEACAQLLQSESTAAQKRAALLCIGEVGSRVGGNLERVRENFVVSLAALTAQTLQDAELSVATAAMQAFVKLLPEMQEEVRDDVSHKVAPALLAVAERAVKRLDDAEANRALTSLCSALVECETLLCSDESLHRAMGLAQACVSNDDLRALDDEVRRSAVEVLVTQAQFAGQRSRAAPQFMRLSFELTLQLFLKGVNDSVASETLQEWNNAAKYYDDEDDENVEFAQSALDALAQSLGPRHSFTLISQMTQMLLTSSDWRNRYVMLLSIAQCADWLESNDCVKLLCDAVLPCFNDPEPRVRYACLHCCALAAPEHLGHMAAQGLPQIFAGICKLLQDQENPRVVAHAATCVMNFVDETNVPFAVLSAQLPSLSPALMQSVQFGVSSGNAFVLQNSLAAFAALADFEGALEHPAVSPVIPQLLQTCAQFASDFCAGPPATAISRSVRELETFARVCECLTMVMRGLPKEQVQQQTQQFVLATLPLMQAIDAIGTSRECQLDDGLRVGHPSEHPLFSYILGAWSRCATVLGTECAKFLPSMAPIVLRAATMDVEVVEGGGDLDTAGTEDTMENMLRQPMTVVLCPDRVDARVQALSLLNYVLSQACGVDADQVVAADRVDAAEEGLRVQGFDIGALLEQSINAAADAMSVDARDGEELRGAGCHALVAFSELALRGVIPVNGVSAMDANVAGEIVRRSLSLLVSHMAAESHLGTIGSVARSIGHVFRNARVQRNGVPLTVVQAVLARDVLQVQEMLAVQQEWLATTAASTEVPRSLLGAILTSLCTLVEQSSTRALRYHLQSWKPELDEEAQDEQRGMANMENEVCVSVTDAIGEVCRAVPSLVLPLLKSNIVPRLMATMLQPSVTFESVKNKPDPAQRLTLFLFVLSDVLEYVVPPQEAEAWLLQKLSPEMPTFLQLILECVNNTSAKMRQVCAHLLRVIMERFSVLQRAEIGVQCVAALENAAANTSNTDDETETDKDTARENVAAALARALALGMPRGDTALTTLLQCLPITTDPPAAARVASVLLQAAVQGEQRVLSQLPQVFRSLGTVLQYGGMLDSDNHVPEQEMQHLRTLSNEVMKRFDESTQRQLWQAMSPPS